MWDCYFDINIDDHLLKFNGLSLEEVLYEPDYGCFIKVEHDTNYFISGETDERIEIATQYRGLKGTFHYQVDILIDGKTIKTLMVQTTPNGEIYSKKEDEGYF